MFYRDLAAPGNYEFELKHKVIIDRFGRYPHRNAILGRVSTDEEIEFPNNLIPVSKFSYNNDCAFGYTTTIFISQGILVQNWRL